MNNKIEFTSLFSGCGGMDCGMHMAGFQTVYANEYDKRIIPTYRRNFPGVDVDTSDIRAINFEDLPDTRGIIGSPPCQSWSAAGAGRGAMDPRGKLFYVYCDIIAAKKPEFFVAENVAGMLQGKKVEAFQYLIGQLKSCGYHVAYKLVDCADYGVPQNRERVFIVGLRSDTYDSEFVFPEPTHIGNRTTLQDAIGDLGAPQELNQNRNNQWDSFNHEYSAGTWSPHFMSRQRVRSWDECSYTIPATGRHVPLHPSANKMISAGPDKYVFDPNTPCPYRRLSVRECARIQTFPDDFVFEYDAIDAGYLMVGNAVPVEMARIIGVALKERLDRGV